MKSLERRFNNISKKNPNLSSYLCFVEAVRGQGFSKQTIHNWFSQLVDKEDYNKTEKRALLEHLTNLSNVIEEGIK